MDSGTLVDVVVTRLAGPDGWLDLLDRRDVDEGIGVFADSEHR
jgi:hypothetical protein